MKAYKHWEYEMKGYIEFTIENQSKEGFFYEIVKPIDDFHNRTVDSSCLLTLDDDNLGFVRLEVEADVEYLVVEGAVTIYKVTGDDEWMKRMLPGLERGIDYCTSNPKRWDTQHGLVKRPFTIDTWDFAYLADSSRDRGIHDHTPMSIMHGDNSGVYQAMMQLAWINGRFGNNEKKNEWEIRARQLRENLNRYCWNGKFYIHQLHLGHNGLEVNEAEILSLSNAYDMNRGVTTFEQNQKIIGEYQHRRQTTELFAEWFSIDPPYPSFGGLDNNLHPAGKYINGGIASFTAGELARAAFKNGYEEYGWDIIKRMQKIAKRDGTVHFLYDPKTSVDLGGGPSGWGAATLMAAFEEGMAGIEDSDVCFRILKFSPRWVLTDYTELRYITGYELSKCLIETIYRRDDESMVFELSCPSEKIDCHIMLPQGKNCKSVELNQNQISFSISKVNNTSYIDFSFAQRGIPYPRDEWKKQHRNIIFIKF